MARTDAKFNHIQDLANQILAETTALVKAELTPDAASETAFDAFQILAELGNKVTDMVQSGSQP